MRTINAVLVLLVLCVGTPAAQQWTHETDRDQMTDKLSAYAYSPATSPTDRMSFPYSDVQAWLGVGCDDEDEWAYIGFTHAPNIPRAEPQIDGYSTFSTRIRWDDSVQTVNMFQQWGSRFLRFVYGNGTVIANARAARTALLELEWYGAGKVYFRFSLAGASAAIDSARQACRKSLNNQM